MDVKRDEYYKNLIAKFKEDPLFELKQELGCMLLRHISTFTKEERQRYDELIEILTQNQKTHDT